MDPSLQEERFKKHRIQNHLRSAPTSDNVYVDLKVENVSEMRTVKAQFTQTKTTQLLDNPSNYYLTLARWKVPAFELPVLIFPINKSSNAGPDESQYIITFETSTGLYSFPLYYVSYNVPNTGIPKLVGDGTAAPSKYWFVYSYQQMLNIINHALQMCFDNVVGKPVGATTAPYMIYDSATKLFSLIAEQPYFTCDITPQPSPPTFPNTPPTFDAPIKIFFNYKLYSLFNSIPSRTIPSNQATNHRDVQILVADYKNNTTPSGELIIQQDFSSVTFWNPVKQILFLTKLIPINSEYTSVSSNSFQKILTDFEPTNSWTSDVQTTLQYFPQGQYRLTDLIGNQPLYNIDLTVKWLDIDGNEYFVEIPPFQQFSAKLLFLKRNLVKTDNLLYDH